MSSILPHIAGYGVVLGVGFSSHLSWRWFHSFGYFVSPTERLSCELDVLKSLHKFRSGIDWRIQHGFSKCEARVGRSGNSQCLDMVNNLCFRPNLLCRAATSLQSTTMGYEWGIAGMYFVHILVYPSFRTLLVRGRHSHTIGLFQCSAISLRISGVTLSRLFCSSC